MKNRKTDNIITEICRLILALTFVFSGFVKAVDPWGTALKVDEYLSIYGIEELSRWSMVFSIWLCGAELMMGLMLLFRVRIRLISIFALASMTFFTLLTFLSATWIPVEDCGCFGDAVKLSPWQTFAKNAVLLPMAWVVWRHYRPDRIFAFRRIEVVLTVLFFCIAMGVGTYCYRHLPLLDFLPYRVGVNIAEAMEREAAAPAPIPETVLVYRNKTTGRTRKFSLDDKEWHDAAKWEWVDTYTVDAESAMQPTVAEFAVRDAEGDATQELLHRCGRLYMFCTEDVETMDGRCRERIARAVAHAEAEGALCVVLTSRPLHDVTYYEFGGREVRAYNVDASTLKTMLRAHNGLVVLDDGTITAKMNCRDISY